MFSVGEPVPFSPAPGSWPLLPLKRALLPAPVTNFYKFLLPAQAPALRPPKKARLVDFWLLLQLPMIFVTALAPYKNDCFRLQLPNTGYVV